MARTARALVGGVCYHVLNRGNAKMRVFHKRADYAAFAHLLDESCERLPMSVFAFCLMPNHFHLVLRPRANADLSRWMQWLMTSHVRRYHKHYGTSGHVWQGRFKAFPIQLDEHLLTVIRYVERNPMRARLVKRAEDWEWSSLSSASAQTSSRPRFLSDWPIERPSRWREMVNRPLTTKELADVRTSAHRGTPYGSVRWVSRIAERLGLESTLRPRGRPKRSLTTMKS